MIAGLIFTGLIIALRGESSDFYSSISFVAVYGGLAAKLAPSGNKADYAIITFLFTTYFIS